MKSRSQDCSSDSDFQSCDQNVNPELKIFSSRHLTISPNPCIFGDEWRWKLQSFKGHPKQQFWLPADWELRSSVKVRNRAESGKGDCCIAFGCQSMVINASGCEYCFLTSMPRVQNSENNSVNFIMFKLYLK